MPNTPEENTYDPLEPEDDPDTYFIELGAEAAEKESIKRARQYYAQRAKEKAEAEEMERKKSPLRYKPSVKEFDPDTRTWKEITDDDGQ